MKNNNVVIRFLLSIPKKNRLQILFRVLIGVIISVPITLSVSVYLFRERIYTHRLEEIEKQIQKTMVEINAAHLENVKAGNKFSTREALLNLENLSLICEKEEVQTSGMSFIEQVHVLFQLVSGR